MQEIAFDDPKSTCRFSPSVKKPFLITAGVESTFGAELPFECLTRLLALATYHDGIDYLQVFEIRESGLKIWFIEDGEGGAITALLPSEY